MDPVFGTFLTATVGALGKIFGGGRDRTRTVTDPALVRELREAREQLQRQRELSQADNRKLAEMSAAFERLEAVSDTQRVRVKELEDSEMKRRDPKKKKYTENKKE